MTTTPECSHVNGDVDCDRLAVYELTITKPHTLTGDRTELSCEVHVPDLVGDDMLVIQDRLDGSWRSGMFGVTSGSKITADSVKADRIVPAVLSRTQVAGLYGIDPDLISTEHRAQQSLVVGEFKINATIRADVVMQDGKITPTNFSIEPHYP